jgi:hypothetical protein
MLAAMSICPDVTRGKLTAVPQLTTLCPASSRSMDKSYIVEAIRRIITRRREGIQALEANYLAAECFQLIPFGCPEQEGR